MDHVNRAAELLETTLGVDMVALLRDERARAAFAAALRSLAAPGFEVVMVQPDGPRDARHGVDGYLELWDEWTSAFSEFHYEPAGDPVLGENTMVNFVRQRGSLPGSNVEVTAEGAAAWFFRDGRVERIEFHLDPASALRAAGL